MDLQSIFYIIGILAMVSWLMVFFIVIFILVKIKRTTDSFKNNFANKVAGFFKERNVEVASALGLTFAHFVIDRLKKSRASKNN